MEPTNVVAVSAEETAVPVLQFPQQPQPPPPGGVDPTIALFVEEFRRGQDAMRKDLVDEVRGLRSDMQDVRAEVRGLRDQAPGKLSFYLAASVVALAMIAMFGVLLTRGVDVGKVADAVHEIAPVAP